MSEKYLAIAITFQKGLCPMMVKPKIVNWLGIALLLVAGSFPLQAALWGSVAMLVV